MNLPTPFATSARVPCIRPQPRAAQGTDDGLYRCVAALFAKESLPRSAIEPACNHASGAARTLARLDPSRLRWAGRPLLMVLAAFTAIPHASAQTIDAFNPQPQASPVTLTLQADGRILFGGYFLDPVTTTLFGVERVDKDGSLDVAFLTPEVDAEVKAVAVQADGKIVIGGSFTEVDGQPRHHLARLNGDGSLDAGFADPDLDLDVWSIALQSDGKVLAAGDFQNAGAIARAYVARFTTAGALDMGFVDTQICCGPARTVTLQPDGRVLVGGYFLGVVGDSSLGALLRFSATGALDAAFPVDQPATNVSAVVVAPDGSIYVGTSYNTTDNVSLRPVAKLSANGALDTAYADVYTDGGTNTLALQPDGRIAFGGLFQLVDGQPRHALARLSAAGALDAGFRDLQFSFSAGDPNGSVFGLATQRDGNAIAVGNFTLVDGQPRQFAARVATGDAAFSSLVGQASGSSVVATWMRSGAGPELAQPPTLMHSTDGAIYTLVGPMARIANGWQASANFDVHGTPFFLKAIGSIEVGSGNGSPGRVDSPVYVSDRIFANGFD